MNRSRRRVTRDKRQVFRRKRRLPVGMVLRQLAMSIVLLCGGIAIVVLLQRLPEQVDLLVLVSQAVADLISGVQLLLSAMFGLGGIVLVAAGPFLVLLLPAFGVIGVVVFVVLYFLSTL